MLAMPRAPSTKDRQKQDRARVTAYLAAQAPAARRSLRKIREIVRSSAPAAVEVFSYGIPGFRLRGQPFLWYAAWKSHVSLYPIGTALARELAVEGYETAKGTIRFPLDEPLPAALVKRLVRAQRAQVDNR
jgi:uncharacterized protein YdhG (YjbR/CyaY superfamily)